MTQANPTSRFSPERRTILFFFIQSMSVGAANSFGGIWLASKGLLAEQIGVINAVPLLVMMLFALFVGRIADRANDWRQVIVIGAVASGVFPLGLFFVDGFWGILPFWALAVITQSMVIPVVDAAAMRMSRRRGSNFGVFRAWGTIGYLLVILVAGYLVVWFGGAFFLPLFAGLALLRSAAAFGLPNFRAPRDVYVPKKGVTHLKQVMKPWFLLPLLGFAVVNSAHFILNAFQGLLFLQQGIPAHIIGLLIVVGALSEVAMFFSFKRFAGRFSARNLLLLSAAVSVVRWVAMSFSPGVEILFGLQLLHSITYALGFMACMNFIADWTSDDIAAEAQGFFTVLQEGMAILAFISFGWLAGAFGAKAYLASAAFAVLGGALVWISIRLKEAKD